MTLLKRHQVYRFFMRHMAPPLLCFALARILLLIAAAFSNVDPWGSDVWKRFDSNHYLAIAQYGYTLFPCSPEEYSGSNAWCGTSGWFLGYPLLIKTIAFLFPSLEWAAIFISAVFHLSSLLLIWNGFFNHSGRWGDFLCLLLAAFFPGQVYQQAIFPISLITFFILLFLYSLKKQNIIVAGMAASAASFSYPPGILLIGLGLLYLIRQKRVKAAVLLGILGSVGPALILLIFQLQVGHWDAYLKIHHKYNHKITNPLRSFSMAVKPLFRKDGWLLSGKIKLVTFKTQDNHFLSVENQNLIADRTAPGDWETFDQITLSDHNVALRAHTGLFLCTSDRDGQAILALCQKINPKAVFREVAFNDEYIGLRAPNGFFLCIDEGDKKLTIRADCPALGKPSLFKKESRKGSRSQQQAIIAGQTAFLFILLVILLASSLWRRSPIDSVELLGTLFILTFWIFHYSIGGSLTLARAEALLLPAMVLGRNVPPKFLLVLLIIEIPLAFLMGELFFRYVLI